jgi:hypothetical protein
MILTNGIAGSTLATGVLIIILLAYIQSEDTAWGDPRVTPRSTPAEAGGDDRTPRFSLKTFSPVPSDAYS